MKHYRVNKLAKAGGAIVKKKDVLAANDRQAVQDAVDSGECPVCDVLRDGKIVGRPDGALRGTGEGGCTARPWSTACMR
jgi:hypothetical protein